MSIIDVRNIVKVYKDEEVPTVALKNVTFKIEGGEFVSIMGPSGSGKSTLLHILGFLDRPTSGEYLFDGRSMDEYTEDELAHIRNKKMGFVFQSFNLLPRTTVFNNVMLPLLYSETAETKWKEKAHKAIRTVGLENRMEHETAQLSGGERQRVAIARALVNEPEVIFADEPTGNLDSKSGKIIMETIRTLNESLGHTVILITHETYAASYAKRLLRFRDGEIEEDEKVKVRARPESLFIK